MTDRIYLTNDGYNRLKEELYVLVHETRREVLEKIWFERAFSLNIRAEELTLDDWKAIASALANTSTTKLQ